MAFGACQAEVTMPAAPQASRSLELCEPLSRHQKTGGHNPQLHLLVPGVHAWTTVVFNKRGLPLHTLPCSACCPSGHNVLQTLHLHVNLLCLASCTFPFILS